MPGFYVTIQRIIQRGQKNPPLTRQRAVKGTSRYITQSISRSSIQVARIDTRFFRRPESKPQPGNWLSVRQMPYPGFLIDKQIKAYIHEIRNVCGRYGDICRGNKPPTGCKRLQCKRNKIVDVPRPEECAGAYDQGFGIPIKH